MSMEINSTKKATKNKNRSDVEMMNNEQFKNEWVEKGLEFKRLRENYQISRAEIARAIGTSSSRLANFEQGKAVRDARVLENFYKLIIEQKNTREELMAMKELWGSVSKQINYLGEEKPSKQSKIKEPKRKTRLNKQIFI